LVADALGSQRQGADRLRGRSGPVPVQQHCAELLHHLHVRTQEAWVRGADVGDRLQQRPQRAVRAGVEIGLGGHRAGGQDQPQQILRPLGVPAEPEQVAEHPGHHRRRR
jgi:hypothetical protein